MSNKVILPRTISTETILSQHGYTMIKKLSEGSYAKVYLAEFQSKLKEKKLQLACKIINLEKSPNKFLFKFLPRELTILLKINHPHIIPVMSIYQKKNNLYIFMRYAENGDLLDYILENGAVDENLARIWTRQMALGIQYLHILQIAHRDLKCENILLTYRLNCKLADFGFARQEDRRCKEELSHTFCGSVSYAPPEIIHGIPYSPKIADIWSLGVLIFILLNKSHPFETFNLSKLYDDQINRRWKFRSKYENEASTEIKSLVNAMLEPNPKFRITIENVLNSDWIAMNSKLKKLNYAEYKSLISAIEDVQSAGINTELDQENASEKMFQLAFSKRNLLHPNLTIFKEEESAFRLSMSQSDGGFSIEKNFAY